MQADSIWKRNNRGLRRSLVLFGIIASFFISSGLAFAELLLNVQARPGGFDLQVRNASSSTIDIRRIVVGNAFEPVSFTPRLLGPLESFGIELKTSLERFLGGEVSSVTVYVSGMPPTQSLVKVPPPKLSVDTAGIKFGKVWIGQKPERLLAVKGDFDDVTCSDDSVSLAKLEGGKVQVKLGALSPGKVRSYLRFKVADTVYKLPVIADVLPVLEVVPSSIILGRLKTGSAATAEIVLAPGQSISAVELLPNSKISAKVVPSPRGLHLHVSATDFSRDIDEIVELKAKSGASFPVRVTGIAG